MRQVSKAGKVKACMLAETLTNDRSMLAFPNAILPEGSTNTGLRTVVIAPSMSFQLRERMLHKESQELNSR
jgi:hypothetical protein